MPVRSTEQQLYNTFPLSHIEEVVVVVVVVVVDVLDPFRCTQKRILLWHDSGRPGHVVFMA